MIELLLIVCGIFLWIHHRHIKNLRSELQVLRRGLNSAYVSASASASSSSEEAQKDKVDPRDANVEEVLSSSNDDEAGWEMANSTPASTYSTSQNFEEQFGARLPVWIGGLALILAGFFLVKYSIETGLLSPAVRVTLGLLFGCGLLATAKWVRQRQLSDGIRMAQILSGAGIADLYFCLFAATSLYDLIPAWLGFSGMIAVTALAVFLALEHGLPIAVLGLVGGFLTPVMIKSPDPSVPLLFSYLYILLTGFIVVIRQREWWVLMLPVLLGVFLWTVVWLCFVGLNAPSNAIWPGIFLVLASATVFTSLHKECAQECADATPWMNWRKPIILPLVIMAVGTVLLMGLVLQISGFGLLEWGLFWLIALGGIGLAFFRQRLYGAVPWLMLLANVVMFMLWPAAEPARYAITLLAFFGLYAISGHYLQARSEKPLLWSGLVSIGSVAGFLLAYFKLRGVVDLQDIPLLWGGTSLALSIAAVALLSKLSKQIPSDHAQRAAVLSLYAATATAFLSIGLTIELKREFLSVAIAAEMAALCWIYQRFPLAALRWLASVLAFVFAGLLLPQIILLVQLTAYSLVEAKLPLQDNVPMVQWPIFQLGIPAFFFLCGSWLLRRFDEDLIVRVFEVAAIVLIAVMGYYLSRHAFHPNDNILFVKAGFAERGAITNVIMLYGLLCMVVGKRFFRESVLKSGVFLVGIALFRITYFDLIRYNPFWTDHSVGEWPILNALWLPYGLPVLWLWLARRQSSDTVFTQVFRYAGGVMIFLLFVFLTTQVRHLYHGAVLVTGAVSNAEIYTYSLAWLLFGFCLLGIATLLQDRLMRVASLVIMIATVGKVFLYDAAELAGLYRVASFFGLGFSLLVLNWFYARYVFTKEKPLAPPR